MDVRVANEQMSAFLELVIANDLADVIAIRGEAGAYFSSFEREPAEDGTVWTQVGEKVLVANASDGFIDYLVVSGCPEIYAGRLRAQRATLSEVTKLEDARSQYLLLLSMARAWETCEGWDPAWESVPISKSSIHYTNDLADALERGMPIGAASSGIIAGGWL
ncbi:hypothetical protein ACQCSV_13495 [Pseudarthrobacter sp. S3]|uniref:hypothetical protein n=1 Tax=Pseudarthrobacter sp. S3 TaxID=3418419 RepID=UPI003CE78587